jgi:hypothetical protein
MLTWSAHGGGGHLIVRGPGAGSHHMDRDPLNDEVLSRVRINRREMVRRMIIGTAFAVPVVTSFDMAALTTTSAQALNPNQLGSFGSNQTFAAPQFTSASSAIFLARHPDSFDVTASGGPHPTISESGELPEGISLTDNENGSALLAGTPSPGSGGAYGIEFVAANGVPPAAGQAFNLIVHEAPAVDVPGSESFAAGQAGSLLLTATGFPLPTLGLQGSLPAGLSFHAGAGEGTAVISGTPGAGSAGSHVLTVTASNGVSPAAAQRFTLNVVREKTPVDNHFTVTNVSVGKHGGTHFLATVDAAGSITAVLTAHRHGVVGRKHIKIRREGSDRVRLSPNKAGHRLFRHSPSKLSLALSVTFKPKGGSPRTIHVRGLHLS